MPKNLCKQTKEVVSHLINYFERERDNGGPLLPLGAVRERAAEACGLSIATISRISTATKENQPLPSPKRKRTRAEPNVDVDDATQVAIRNVIYEMYRNRQHVTRKSLLSLLKERDCHVLFSLFPLLRRKWHMNNTTGAELCVLCQSMS